MLYLQLEHPLASGWTSPWCSRKSAPETWALGCGTSPPLARSTGPRGGGVARATWSSRRGSRWWAVAWGIPASWRGWGRRGSRQSHPERTGWTPEIKRKKKKKKKAVTGNVKLHDVSVLFPLSPCQRFLFILLHTSPMVLSLRWGKSCFTSNVSLSPRSEKKLCSRATHSQQ